MKVYRVEDRTGCGPYTKLGYTCIHNSPASKAVEQRPIPSDDPGLTDFWDSLSDNDNYTRWTFGFASLGQYIEWFNRASERTILSNYGLYLSAYKVSKRHVASSDKQCIFEKSKAQFLNRLEIAP